MAEDQMVCGVHEDIVHRAAEELDQLIDFRQAVPGHGILHAANAQGGIAVEHAGEHAAEDAGIQVELVRGLQGVGLALSILSTLRAMRSASQDCRWATTTWSAGARSEAHT